MAKVMHSILDKIAISYAIDFYNYKNIVLYFWIKEISENHSTDSLLRMSKKIAFGDKKFASNRKTLIPVLFSKDYFCLNRNITSFRLRDKNI